MTHQRLRESKIDRKVIADTNGKKFIPMPSASSQEKDAESYLGWLWRSPLWADLGWMDFYFSDAVTETASVYDKLKICGRPEELAWNVLPSLL